MSVPPEPADRAIPQNLSRPDKLADWLGALHKATEPLYGHYQSYFPIVQGCTYPDLRVEAAEHVKRGLDADGYPEALQWASPPR